MFVLADLPDWKKKSLNLGFFLIAAAFLSLPFFVAQRTLPATDVIKAWNESIARLGIVPVYPPQEDFFVGDIWAVVANSSDLATPITGKAVRLGHFDVRTTILRNQKEKMKFAGISSQPDNTQVLNKDTATDLIETTLLALPGIKIDVVNKFDASAGIAATNASMSAESVNADNIQIPIAETYGITMPQAMGALQWWCKAPETLAFCDETYARTILAYLLGNAVFQKDSTGKYKAIIQLAFVSRVYMTRSMTMESRNNVTAVSNLSEQMNDKSSDSLIAQRRLSQNIGLDIDEKSIRRPLVFGYVAALSNFPEASLAKN